MNPKLNKYLHWTLRIIISALFLLSAVSKIYNGRTWGVWGFEKQLMELGIATECIAHYLSRLIIALEFAIAVGILIPYFLKRFVIPITVLLLVAFCIHLGITMYLHGNNGSCGCFGELIPMTPLEALIKNVITIAMLIYLYLNINKKGQLKNGISEISSEENADTMVVNIERKFYVLILTFMAFSLMMFMAFPFCKCESKTKPVVVPVTIDTTQASIDTAILEFKDTAKKKIDKKDTAKKKTEEAQPKPVVSAYSKFNNFNGRIINVDKGKKTLCFFSPGCDHCRATAKELCGLVKTGKVPELVIYFMEEEVEKIPDFFKEAGCTFPYQVLSMSNFWNTFGWSKAVPGVNYMWNGNEIKSYYGTEGTKFLGADFLKICNSPFKK